MTKMQTLTLTLSLCIYLDTGKNRILPGLDKTEENHARRVKTRARPNRTLETKGGRGWLTGCEQYGWLSTITHSRGQ